MNSDTRLISLACDCREKFPALSGLSAAQQRRLVRIVRYCVIDQLKGQQRDKSIIRDACLNKVQQQKEFGSLLTVLTVAVLVQIIEYVVKRLLERWLDYEQI